MNSASAAAAAAEILAKQHDAAQRCSLLCTATFVTASGLEHRYQDDRTNKAPTVEHQKPYLDILSLSTS